MIQTLDIPIRRASQSKIDQVDFQNIQFGKIYADHMFIADYDGTQWGDLRIEPFENLSMNPAMSALHYGQSIFEGLKAYKNDAGEALVFRPDRNAARFNVSAVRMCMPELPEEIFLGGLQ